MADLNALVDTLSALTPGDAGNLSKLLEQKWGVKADLGTPVAPVPTAVEAPAPVVQTEFAVRLKGGGPKKIEVIKLIRVPTGLALKEAKEFVEASSEGSPKTVKEGLSREDADKLAKSIADVGGIASVE
jgi:large subunit ribosomal protein L7/L12